MKVILCGYCHIDAKQNLSHIIVLKRERDTHKEKLRRSHASCKRCTILMLPIVT